MEKFKEPFLEKFLRYLRAKIVISCLGGSKIICDIGCGFNAYFLSKVKKIITKGYGIDKKVNIKETGNIILEKAEFFNNLPFKDNYFDAVTMIAVLEHLKDCNSIIKEAHRILKPKGLLIITTPTTQAKKLLEFLAYKLHILNKEEIKEHCQYFNKNEITGLLENNHFFVKKYAYFEYKFNSIAVAIKN